jgi:hypothetical protein
MIKLTEEDKLKLIPDEWERTIKIDLSSGPCYAKFTGNTGAFRELFGKKIFDIVDLRDFIVGAKNGGLIVRLPNEQEARAPYMLPYVCLKTRATISASKEMEFSIKLWEMNKRFYEEIDGNIALKDTDFGLKKLMNYIGFSDDTLLVDICDWHIDKLKMNIEK